MAERGVFSFQSTRPMRGATSRFFLNSEPFEISIHAPRAGRDWTLCLPRWFRWDFNPRAPCGARHNRSTNVNIKIGFQSTRPVRGATPQSYGLFRQNGISIHAPRAGRDIVRRTARHPKNDFNPRAPCGARQQRCGVKLPAAAISIHAPRAGRDPFLLTSVNRLLNFNPRAPCGARRPRRNVSECGNKFQSTRPVRGATAAVSTRKLPHLISIHAPRAGRDCWRLRLRMCRFHFNPRAPCGARRPFLALPCPA